ncbi:MAG: Uma2 family endonuclease [Aeromicrobium sp.]|uniref:Uma2 family endonuclease n=1 Tax=Aeromicrobium sp. TaxID=1871063 RepID=UPI0039E376A6
MSVSVPQGLGPWTVDDLPEDGRRYELLDGWLIVSPAAAPRHELAAGELAFVLKTHLARQRVLSPVGVDFANATYLVPDLAVTAEGVDVWNVRHLGPGDVDLVVEVVSPGSTRHDQVIKRARYAAEGIAAYWIVETDPDLVLTALELRPDAQAYVEVGRWSGDDTVSLDRPFPVSFRLSELRG